MELIAGGRDADVFDAGPGRVLRRYRNPTQDTTREAAIMRHAARAGYPVPAVYEADGPDLVLERIEGPTLFEAMTRRPWKLRSYAGLLADLHTRLGRIPAPGDAHAPFGAGDSLLHLDLHPGNVVMGGAGPVVIDWTNAARGPAAAGVADTWLVVASARPDATRLTAALAASAQGLFTRWFLTGTDREAAREHLLAAFARRARDRNMRADERHRMQAVVRRESGREA